MSAIVKCTRCRRGHEDGVVVKGCVINGDAVDPDGLASEYLESG